jgi:hypothetical protein
MTFAFTNFYYNGLNSHTVTLPGRQGRPGRHPVGDIHWVASRSRRRHSVLRRILHLANRISSVWPYAGRTPYSVRSARAERKGATSPACMAKSPAAEICRGHPASPFCCKLTFPSKVIPKGCAYDFRSDCVCCKYGSRGFCLAGLLVFVGAHVCIAIRLPADQKLLVLLGLLPVGGTVSP